jgi:Rod binding domain-containing protein
MDANQLTPSIDPSSARILQGTNVKTSSPTSINEAKLKQAAQGFERTLVRQMLSSARNTNLNGMESQSSTSKSYLELMDDHVADLLSKGSGIGFGRQMAEQLIAQANAAKLSGSQEIAVKPLNTPRSAPASAETLQSLQRPNGFASTPQ